MLKIIPICMVLAALASGAGCRRVVLISFDGRNLDQGTVDTLAITGIHPEKDFREFTGLQTIGYFDVEGNSITVHVQACDDSGRRLVDQQNNYPLEGDEVTIKLVPWDGDPQCTWGQRLVDAGMGGQGQDGSAGSTGTGGAPGTGGDLGGTGGTTAGPDGGDARDGGPDTAECGTETHAPTCDPPSGDAGADEVPPPATFSAACDTYCNGMQTKCAGISASYESLETCRRYCNQAGWSVGDGSNRDDSLGCRNNSLGLVTPGSFNQGLFCANAGPTGNGYCGLLCQDFCAAWTNLCGASTNETTRCLSACQASTLSCRFQLLQRAVFDRRYCSYVSFDSCLVCN